MKRDVEGTRVDRHYGKDVAAHRFHQNTNLFLSIPSHVSSAGFRTAMSVGYRERLGVSESGWWRKKLEYSRACPVNASRLDYNEAKYLGKRLLHRSTRISRGYTYDK